MLDLNSKDRHKYFLEEDRNFDEFRFSVDLEDEIIKLDVFGNAE
jgi:hypothetical protein